MVKTRDQIKRIIRKYATEVARDYRVEAILLFGSYANGTASEHSDIDVVIVSPDFRGKPEMQILQDLSRKTMKIDTSLEVLAFTPEDMDAADPLSFAYQVKKNSIKILMPANTGGQTASRVYKSPEKGIDYFIITLFYFFDYAHFF